MSLVQFEIDLVFLNLIKTSDNNDYRTLLVVFYNIVSFPKYNTFIF
jgi:hypothetical protein